MFDLSDTRLSTSQSDNVSNYVLSQPIQKSCVQPSATSIANERVSDRAAIDVEDNLRFYRATGEHSQVECGESLQMGQSIVRARRHIETDLSTAFDRQIQPLQHVAIDVRMNSIPSLTVAGMNSRQLLREAADIVKQQQ